MLVLTRKIGESIIVTVDGVEIKIKLVKTSKGNARIGIDAPVEAVIVREELASEVQHG